MNVFITGNSSGLGLGLTAYYLAQGDSVFGLSRRGCALDHPNLRDTKLDLMDSEAYSDALTELLSGVSEISIAILNAGILGDIKSMQDTEICDLEKIMQVNVWSNKLLMDWLIQNNVAVDQLILISSGASVNGGYGWSGYSMSKAALNMLAQLYAHEMPDTHVTSLAPGVIDTYMQETIRNPGLVDAERFPSFNTLRELKTTGNMPDVDTAARNIASRLHELKSFKSGSFQDIRQI